MLDECNGCKYQYKYERCAVIIEKDPHFRSLNCPCFTCLIKVTCHDACKEQWQYINRRWQISEQRLYEIEIETLKLEKLIEGKKNDH